MTRSDAYFRRLFKASNMEILETLDLHDDKELYRVMGYALRPRAAA